MAGDISTQPVGCGTRILCGWFQFYTQNAEYRSHVWVYFFSVKVLLTSSAGCEASMPAADRCTGPVLFMSALPSQRA